MERRTHNSNPQNEGNKLVGYAAVFDAPATIREGNRTFTEVIRSCAFTRALKDGADVICTFNHDVNKLLGRTSAGTLKLHEDSKGLRFEVELPEYARDVAELVNRGDVRGCSFTFGVRPGGESWDGETRVLTDLDLIEVGPVALPAYPETSVGLRSRKLYVYKLLLREKSN